MRTRAVLGALNDAFSAARTFGSSATQIVGGDGIGFGEAIGDIEIVADERLADLVSATLIACGFQHIDVEGRSTQHLPSGNGLSAFVDPLDGSLNFKRCNGSVGLPYATVIATAPSLTPCFAEFFEAGVIDLRSGDTWYTDDGRVCWLNAKPCITSGARRIDKAAGTIIVADCYYPATRAVIAAGFNDFRGYIRTPGAAGYELALVASGSVDAFISTDQKCDVLGAAYRLITAAGGVVVDFDGNDLASRTYGFRDQIPIVAAATRELATEILERIH